MIPIHRCDLNDREKREKDKQWKRVNWYRSRGFSATLFVPATPDSRLTNLIQASSDASTQGPRVRVMERNGPTTCRGQIHLLKHHVQTLQTAFHVQLVNWECTGKILLYTIVCISCADTAQGPAHTPPIGTQGPPNITSTFTTTTSTTILYSRT